MRYVESTKRVATSCHGVWCSAATVLCGHETMSDSSAPLRILAEVLLCGILMSCWQVTGCGIDDYIVTMPQCGLLSCAFFGILVVLGVVFGLFLCVLWRHFMTF